VLHGIVNYSNDISNKNLVKTLDVCFSWITWMAFIFDYTVGTFCMDFCATSIKINTFPILMTVQIKLLHCFG
jgi:hypothetical protein